MIIGKWNKSVILTYVGMSFAILGIYFCAFYQIKHALSCLIISGVCDLFDGVVARRMKRTQQEEEFGVQLDSLVDMINFVSLPIAIYLSLGFTNVFHLVIYLFFAIASIARLAFFNISTINEGSPTHYRGLPVTYIALILPFGYLSKFFLSQELFVFFFPILLLIAGFLYILDIKIVKPKGLMYVFFAALAVVMVFMYQVIL